MRSLKNLLSMMLVASVVVFSSCKDDKAEELTYTFNVTVPEGTDDAEVYIALGINDGVPSATFSLLKGADGIYSITVSGLEESIEYLYILNDDMEYVEMASDCTDKTLRKIGSSTTIYDTVENWKGVTCIDEDTDNTEESDED
jgi:hypothetical protein